MKICPTCNTPLEDNALFCRNCGARVDGQAQNPNPNPAPNPNQNPYGGVYPPPVPPQVNPYDRTAEFDRKDISDNKLYAMLVYLMGIMGLVIALLGGKDSAYLQFHVRQYLKITIAEALMAIVVLLLCWTVIVPIAGAIMYVVLVVIRIICFFQICNGKAVEAPIVRSLPFLR